MSYNTYSSDVISMDFGLDLSSPKPVAKSGTLNACLNYEITDRVGLRRIDGFERYDGRCAGGCTTFWEIGVNAGLFTAGDTIAVYVNNDTTSTAQVLGVVVAVVALNTLRVAVINDALIAVIKDSTGLVVEATGASPTLYTIDSTTKALRPQGAVAYVRDIRYALPNPHSLMETIRQYQSYLRSQVTKLPSTPLLTYTYRGVTYSAAGVLQFRANSVAQGEASITTTPYAVLGNSRGSATIRVLRIDANAGHIVVHYTPLSGDFAANSGIGATLTGISGTLAGPVNDTTFVIDHTSFAASDTYASLHFCAGEQVEYEQLSGIRRGWRPVDMGYTLPFSGGNAASGNIAKFERGLGIPSGSYLYWLSNGSTVFTCEVNSYYVNSGGFAEGTAAGVLQISSLVRLSGTGSAPTVGYTLYNSASLSPSSAVAVISGPLVANLLPGLNELLKNGSRYQLLDRNFYATDGLGMVYGVSGASRAFYFTKDRFAFLYTAPTEALFPRHLGFVSFSLVLGHSDGRSSFSVPGEPWNYSGVSGAYEYGAGYPVRGLLQMQGDTIGIFTSGGVFAVQGSTQDNYVGRTLVPNIGAIEYTVVSVGDTVFVSPAGVVSLSQSNKYGDFVGEPISYKVNPLIRPRAGLPGRVVAAIPVRNKNQYRLFCSDGTVFSMTFREGREVESTVQTYYVDRASAEDFRGRHVVPFGLSSVLDDDGQEVILFSHYSPISRSKPTFVYKADHGWGFDGTSIPAEFDLNWHFAQQPFTNKVLRKVRLDGVSFGQATLSVKTAKDYSPVFSKAVRADTPETPRFLTGFELPYTRLVNLEERGLNIGIQVEHLPEFSATEPSHTLQTLFIQFTGAKTDA